MLIVIDGRLIGQTKLAEDYLLSRDWGVDVSGDAKEMDSDALVLAQFLHDGGNASYFADDVEAMVEHLKASNEISFSRVIDNGGTVNICCLVKMWEKCLETVQSLESTDCYAISADKFFDVFEVSVKLS